MKTLVTTILVLFISSSSAVSQVTPAPGAAPAWFLDEIARLTAGSGRWVADNSAYKSEHEPYDDYGTEWKSSFDGTTMSGRLFGLKDDREVGNFWEFRQYWHPGRNQAVIEQFGWGGTVGIGRMWLEGDTTKSEQTFYAADGSENRAGHISSFPDADTHITDSFDIENDRWTPRRNYIWHRAASVGD